MNRHMFIRNGALAIISKIKKKSKFLKSMSFRLFCVFLLIGMVPSIIFNISFFSNYEDRMIQRRIYEVQNQCNILGRQLTNGNYMSDQSSSSLNSVIVQLANLYNGRIIIVNSGLKIIKDTYALTEKKTLVSEAVIKCFRGENRRVYDREGEFIELTVPITVTRTGTEEREIVGVVVVSVPTADLREEQELLAGKSRILMMVLMIIVIAAAMLCSGIFVRPFKKILASFNKITAGDLTENVAISGYSEIEQISEAFNKMLARIRLLDESRQEFVSNVSHELKTPITSMKVLADSLISQEEVPAELYKEFMVDIADEIDRENKIITDLLSLVKLDKTSADMNITVVVINELLELILKRLRPIAAKRNIELVLESFRSVTAEVDEVKLTLALSNLIENAIKYNRDDGWVKVTLNADHKFFYVKVADSGIGIPEEEEEKVFDRFYRVDKARSRETGGTGLGLSITKNVILMHNGQIKLYSKENEGTTFTVRIPLTYIG